MRLYLIILASLLLITAFIMRRRLGGYWKALWDLVGLVVPGIPRQKLVALISLAASLVAVLATWWWLQNYTCSMAEPASQLVTVIAWLIVAIVQFLIPADPEWEIIHAKRAKCDREVLEEALRTIQEERLDFYQIRDREGRYNSPAHRKAAEVTSFEMLLPKIETLRSFPRYRRRAKVIIGEIVRNQSQNPKDVTRLIALLDQIEPVLQQDIEKLGRVCRGLA